MSGSEGSYRHVLVEKQYRSGSNLAARQAIYRWREPIIDLYEWALDQIEGFTLENGAAQLSDAFESIERRDLRGELAVPDAGALVAYVDSQSTPLAWLLPDMDRWPDVLREVEDRARVAIARDAVLRIGTEVGVFVCR